MSSAFLSSLITSDLLAECDMKPWWEKIRSNVFLVAFVLSLYLAYDVPLLQSATCGPANISALKLSTPESKYVNAQCAQQLPPWLTNFRYVNLVLCLVTYCIYSVWLAIPAVTTSFKSLRQCDEILAELKLTRQQVQDAIVEICKSEGIPGKRLPLSDEIKSTLTEVCCEL